MPSTYTSLLYHLVFATKHRSPRITSEVQNELYAYVGGVLVKNGGVLLEIGGIEDHVHILASLRASRAVSELLHKIKGSSSRWMNERFPSEERFSWQGGYSAFTVSPSQVSRVRRYIQNQREHHQRVSYEKELERLLVRHGISSRPSE